MSDVFISYARSSAAQASAAAKALRAAGYSVWLDEDLPAHRPYGGEIEAQLTAAKAALVIWSADAVRSDWVLSEANRAREDRKLVQVMVDPVRLPMPFDQIQCADLSGWTGETAHAGWRKALVSIEELAGATRPAASNEVAPAPALPDKPSIAVLPFADPAGAAEGDYFADGMVDDITAALGRYRGLFVIDSGSTLTYRTSGKSPREIARELGVRYVLEGSIRRSGQRVRIALQLADTVEGVQVWTHRFDGALDDVFALQDEVAAAVGGQIEPTLVATEARRAVDRPTSDLTAYQLWTRGRFAFRRIGPENLDEAVRLHEEAIARDPNYGRALAGLAIALSARIAAEPDRTDHDADRRRMFELCDRALAVAADDPDVLAFVSITYWGAGRDPLAASDLAERALALNPNLAIGWYASACTKFVLGRYEEALERFRRQLRLDPNTFIRGGVMVTMGGCMVGLHRFEEALTLLREGLELGPGNVWGLIYLAIAQLNLGRADEARQTVALIPSRQKAALSSRTGLGAEVHALLDDAKKRLGLDA